MTTTTTPDPMCRCGHPLHRHWNRRTTLGSGEHPDPSQRTNGRQPCQVVGRHDMRCSCRDWSPSASKESRKKPSEIKGNGDTIDAAVRDLCRPLDIWAQVRR